jgi:3'-5' exoribonuclease
LKRLMTEQHSLDIETLAGPAPSIRELADGQRIAAVFCVRERELRQKKNGEPFLRLVLGDNSGSAEAISWEEPEQRFQIAEPGSAVHVAGTFEQSQRWGAKVKIQQIRPANPDEYEPEQLLAGPTRSVDGLLSDLRELAGTVQNPHLQALLAAFFTEGSEKFARFRDAPAAKHYHQAYKHGLLEHTISVAQAVSAAAGFFPGIDRDVAVSGALLHDIGKTQAYNDDPMAIELTDLGRLHGEIPLGYYLVRREIEEIPGFEERLAEAVLHIILSHHGALEHGSPVVPCTREAALVHAIDNLGGKLGSFDRLERELPDGQSWSRFDRALEGSAFFGARAA